MLVERGMRIAIRDALVTCKYIHVPSIGKQMLASCKASVDPLWQSRSRIHVSIRTER